MDVKEHSLSRVTRTGLLLLVDFTPRHILTADVG